MRCFPHNCVGRSGPRPLHGAPEQFSCDHPRLPKIGAAPVSIATVGIRASGIGIFESLENTVFGSPLQIQLLHACFLTARAFVERLNDTGVDTQIAESRCLFRGGYVIRINTNRIRVA